MTTPHTTFLTVVLPNYFQQSSADTERNMQLNKKTLTPNGGVIRKGTRGEGDDQRAVIKRLQLTPGGSHEAFYETCNEEGCSQEKRCEKCKHLTNKNIENARQKKRREEEKEEEDRKKAAMTPEQQEEEKKKELEEKKNSARERQRECRQR